jgi:hypothetical protein
MCLGYLKERGRALAMCREDNIPAEMVLVGL